MNDTQALFLGTPEGHAQLVGSGFEPASPLRPGEGLGQEELLALARLGTTRSYRSRTVIASEGDLGEAIYLVLAGRVDVFVSDEQGREVLLGRQGPGEQLGAMVLDSSPRSASVITIEHSRIAAVPKPKLDEFLIGHPAVALEVVRSMVTYTRALAHQVKSLALVDVQGRVTRLLAELSSENGASGVIRRMTQQEIANRVGASREMISRVLRDLSAAGCIEVGKDTIRILPPPRRS